MNYKVTIKNYGVSPDVVKGLLHYLNKDDNKADVLSDSEVEIESELSIEELNQYAASLKEQYNASILFTKLEVDKVLVELKQLLKICPYGLSFEEIKSYFDLSDKEVKLEYLIRFEVSFDNRYMSNHEVFYYSYNENKSAMLRDMNIMYKKLLAKKKYISEENTTVNLIKSIIYFAKINTDFTNASTLIKKADKNRLCMIALELHDIKDQGVFVTEKIANLNIKDNVKVVKFVLSELYDTYDQSISKERAILEDLLFRLSLNLEYEKKINYSNTVKKLLYKTYMRLYEVSGDIFYLSKARKENKEKMGGRQ